MISFIQALQIKVKGFLYSGQQIGPFSPSVDSAGLLDEKPMALTHATSASKIEFPSKSPLSCLATNEDTLRPLHGEWRAKQYQNGFVYYPTPIHEKQDHTWGGLDRSDMKSTSYINIVKYAQ